MEQALEEFFQAYKKQSIFKKILMFIFVPRCWNILRKGNIKDNQVKTLKRVINSSWCMPFFFILRDFRDKSHEKEGSLCCEYNEDEIIISQNQLDYLDKTSNNSENFEPMNIHGMKESELIDKMNEIVQLVYENRQKILMLEEIAEYRKQKRLEAEQESKQIRLETELLNQEANYNKQKRLEAEQESKQIRLETELLKQEANYNKQKRLEAEQESEQIRLETELLRKMTEEAKKQILETEEEYNELRKFICQKFPIETIKDNIEYEIKVNLYSEKQKFHPEQELVDEKNSLDSQKPNVKRDLRELYGVSEDLIKYITQKCYKIDENYNIISKYDHLLFEEAKRILDGQYKDFNSNDIQDNKIEEGALDEQLEYEIFEKNFEENFVSYFSTNIEKEHTFFMTHSKVMKSVSDDEIKINIVDNDKEDYDNASEVMPRNFFRLPQVSAGNNNSSTSSSFLTSKKFKRL